MTQQDRKFTEIQDLSGCYIDHVRVWIKTLTATMLLLYIKCSEKLGVI